MAKSLGRDLGLYAVITISMGAMIGSGIFVLPGAAAKIAGPAVILAYLLAGLLVLPAALSKAEMASALPESGGTYLFIERAMGPLLGTIAGLGAWFSLVFKSAFALVGLGAYLLLFVGNLPTKPVALLLALLLVAVNILGVKQTGRLQAAIVTGVLLVLTFFIVEGITYVEPANYHPFLGQGLDGLLAATGFVFVSYAGVTKIASVAEEVEDPGRNIPLGILLSLGIMMLIYAFIVFVIVGVTEKGIVEQSLTPMAVAAEQFLGTPGVVLITVTAVLALTSMANAGILSSSRYPFAMSRDGLAPSVFQNINERFRTPAYSVGITGAVLLLLIAFVPVVDLAKLASAFQILVFSLVNLALIAFRESALDWYDPPFRSPGYPWIQLAGLSGGLLLLTQMGVVPLVGAVVMIGLGILWYQFYGRSRTAGREGAALDALRRSTDEQSVEQVRLKLPEQKPLRILVPVHPDISEKREETLLHIAADLVRAQGGEIQLLRLVEVPQQVSLSAMAAVTTPEEVRFERRTDELAHKLDVQVEVGELVSHDSNRAVVDYARRHQIDLVLAEVEGRHWRIPLFGGGVEWLMDHLPCDSIFVKNRGLQDIREIAIVGERGPYDLMEIAAANAIAVEQNAQVRLLMAVRSDASEMRVNSIQTYHEKLAEFFAVPTHSEIMRVPSRSDALDSVTNNADLLIVSASAHRYFPNTIFGEFTDRVADQVDRTVLLVHSHASHRHTFLRYALERLIH